MVNQGDIILIDFSPTEGTEQSGNRPALVISNDSFNMHSTLKYILPITSKIKGYPLHIPLDCNTKTQGVIMCDQLKAMDIDKRGYKLLEKLPNSILKQVLAIIKASF